MEIKYIEPSVRHDEMLRLRKEKQMDFLECLSGMDWGIPDEKDAPDTPRGLGVVYLLESTVTGERIAVRTATLNREHPELPSVSDIWILTSAKSTTFTASFSSVIRICADSICAMTG